MTSVAAPTARSHWRGPSGVLYPVIDATVGTLIPSVSAACVARATPGDPCTCALAQQWMETTGAIDCMIGRTIAYLVVRRDGRQVALRFAVPARTRRAIIHFDATGYMPDEGFEMAPISRSNRLDSKRADQKRMRERWAEKGQVRNRNPEPRDSTFRNASDIARTIVMRQEQS